MDSLCSRFPLRIDLVYADPCHPENIFQTSLYRPEAKLWLHRDLADIVVLAASECFRETGNFFVLKDGLRPVDVQVAMHETKIVKANPHWTTDETRMLALPGKGGHPRGMAIDITLETEDGRALDMGTRFDHLPYNPYDNPSSRTYEKISNNAKINRHLLCNAMMEAATAYSRPLLPLPSEWWDFRFPAVFSERYSPIFESDLPLAKQMTSRRREGTDADAPCSAQIARIKMEWSR
ncbi:M15 family metallopeptidase [Paraburkholderia rhynchosiae]|uniref:M15 family metallopeptidase n=2 Tax=Paraburkholderia TaxID=1822464 RepID=A0ACC7NM60_9BURK